MGTPSLHQNPDLGIISPRHIVRSVLGKLSAMHATPRCVVSGHSQPARDSRDVSRATTTTAEPEETNASLRMRTRRPDHACSQRAARPATAEFNPQQIHGLTLEKIRDSKWSEGCMVLISVISILHRNPTQPVRNRWRCVGWAAPSGLFLFVGREGSEARSSYAGWFAFASADSAVRGCCCCCCS